MRVSGRFRGVFAPLENTLGHIESALVVDIDDKMPVGQFEQRDLEAKTF